MSVSGLCWIINKIFFLKNKFSANESSQIFNLGYNQIYQMKTTHNMVETPAKRLSTVSSKNEWQQDFSKVFLLWCSEDELRY